MIAQNGYRWIMSQVAHKPAQNRDQTRLALIEVATRLLRDAGPAAVTTRAVAAAAGVQAPTIYRLFGDKGGLLDAVAEHALTTYVSEKAAHRDGSDPIAELRSGWDTHIEFGLANPALFALLVDPNRAQSPATMAGLQVLQARVHRVAAAGRLRVTEREAVALLHAAGTGAVLTLIATPRADRNLGLVDAMYDAVMGSILADRPERSDGATVSAAVALRAAMPSLRMLTAAERVLLAEWLDRVTTH